MSKIAVLSIVKVLGAETKCVSHTETGYVKRCAEMEIVKSYNTQREIANITLRQHIFM